MFAVRILLLAAAASLLLSSAALADCCAGGHVQFLVNGSQFGYGSGFSVGRTARPFAGLPNPRYLATTSVGGPIEGAGPSTYIARRAFVNTPQLIALAAARDETPVAFASDAELMASEPPADEPQEQLDGQESNVPLSPGQAFWQLDLRARLEADPVAARQPSLRDKPTAPRPQPAPRPQAAGTAVARRAATRTVATRQATGAFASESASRIARNLQAGGLGF